RTPGGRAPARIREGGGHADGRAAGPDPGNRRGHRFGRRPDSGKAPPEPQRERPGHRRRCPGPPGRPGGLAPAGPAAGGPQPLGPPEPGPGPGGPGERGPGTGPEEALVPPPGPGPGKPEGLAGP